MQNKGNHVQSAKQGSKRKWLRQGERIIVQRVKGSDKMNTTKKIGLTGIMGAGKSSVIKILHTLAIPVLDCDAINRELIQKGERGYRAIVKAFGTSILTVNGDLDSQKMSDVIFTSKREKEKLEAILHPMIQEEIRKRCEACSEALIVVEVPLLFEVHWESYFDEVWVVTCEQERLLQRLETYRHISREEALRRLSHQMGQAEKCAKADVVLHNDEGIAELQTQIELQIQRLRKDG